jgi:DNA polymerase-3 subunit epsilon
VDVSGSAGVSLGDASSLLTERAADFLAGGPADPQLLISYVCQIPGAPRTVAEHMAAALFAGQRRFVRDGDGRWCLRDGQFPAEGALVAGGVLAATAGPPSLADEPFVVVDVETTGTRATGGDRITEIAVVRVQHGEATLVFDSLINPERAIPPAIVAITNITWEMVKDAPRFADVCDQLLGVLEGNVFVAHNAAFDWRFVTAEVARATRRPLSGRTLCTVRLARRMLPQLRRRNLDALAAFYGVDNPARHRAGGDALVTARILLRLLDAARDRGCASFDDVDRLVRAGSSVRRRPRRAPALPHSTKDDGSA